MKRGLAWMYVYSIVWLQVINKIRDEILEMVIKLELYG